MIFIILALIAIIIVLAFFNVRKEVEEKKENKIEEILPYQKKYLLTKNEWKFYKNIKHLCDENNIHIIAKVRFADLVEVQTELEYKEKQRYFNKIKNKHIDFVLCKPENLEVIALLELDDISHQRKDRKESDELKNKICEKVGYKLIRVKNIEEFKENLDTLTQIKKNGVSEKK